MKNISSPILITGAGGILGTDLCETFSKILPTKQLIPFDRQALDITHPKAVANKIFEVQPAIVVNAAAYTNVDGAETEKEKAYAVNVQGARNLAACCEMSGAKLVHFSTDQVFDGSRDQPWAESDPTSPSNYYAKTKLEGEKEVLRLSSALVLRVQWLYGKRKDRFTPLKGREVFTPFADQFGAPTWTKHVSEVLVRLLQKEVSGLYHFAYDDNSSWADVFQFVKEQWNLSVQLKPLRTAEICLPAGRPLNARLSNKKLLGVLEQPTMGSWKTALKEFLAEVR